MQSLKLNDLLKWVSNPITILIPITPEEEYENMTTLNLNMHILGSKVACRRILTNQASGPICIQLGLQLSGACPEPCIIRLGIEIAADFLLPMALTPWINSTGS